MLIWGGWEQKACENYEKSDLPLAFLCHCWLRCTLPTNQQGTKASWPYSRGLSLTPYFLCFISTNKKSLHWPPWLWLPSLTSQVPIRIYPLCFQSFLKCQTDQSHPTNNGMQTSLQPHPLLVSFEKTPHCSFHA